MYRAARKMTIFRLVSAIANQLQRDDRTGLSPQLCLHGAIQTRVGDEAAERE